MINLTKRTFRSPRFGRSVLSWCCGSGFLRPAALIHGAFALFRVLMVKTFRAVDLEKLQAAPGSRPIVVMVTLLESFTTMNLGPGTPEPLGGSAASDSHPRSRL